MDERETRITRRLKRELGTNYFVKESPLGRAERVDIIKKGEFFRHPPYDELQSLIKRLFPDVNFNLRVFENGFFDSFAFQEKDDLVLEFNDSSDYRGHFIVFGNENHLMLSLVWRGRYPLGIQQDRYVDLVKETYSRFYQK